MINALPLFLVPLGSPNPANGQTGETGLDQPQTPEKTFNNPFAKILRDQSAAFSPHKSLQFSVQSGEQRRLPDLESPQGNPNLSLQILAGPDMPGDLFRENGSDSVELALSIDAQPNPSSVTLLDSDGQTPTELGDVISLSAISLPALGGNEGNAIGVGKIPQVPMRPSSGDVLQEGPLTPAVFLPKVFLAGGPGPVEVQTPFTMNQPVLPLLKGFSSIQTPPVGRILADHSPSPMVVDSDQQPILQDTVKEHSQLKGSLHRELGPESAGELGKNVGKPLDRLSGTVQDSGMLLQRIPPPLARTSVEPLRPLVNQAFQSPLPFEETPASLADMVQASQNRLKYVNGVSSILSDVSGHGKESPMAIPSDLLRDPNLSSTGDRSKDGVDATGKSVGVDPNGGQGVNNGMGGSTNSQPGFQQSSSSPSPGPAVRMAEERVPDLPGPALQRLQMEVQLSETNRVQIDVGVQHRQVYASLLMDQATLKNLAVQFAPQLEEQLAQGEMELQEFSAEVRDHHGEPESHTRSDGPGTQTSQRGTRSLQDAQGSVSHVAKRAEEQGLHLVA